MKKIIGSIILVLVVAAGVTGCKKIVKAIFPGLDIDVPAITVALPAIPFAPPNELQLGSFQQRFNLDSVVKANTNGAFGASDVSSVKVKQMNFSVSNADQSNNLSNFESARFNFSSNSNPTPAEIANITFPETYSDNFSYTPTTTPDLRPYLNGTQLNYDVFGKIRRRTTKSVTLTIRVTLSVR